MEHLKSSVDRVINEIKKAEKELGKIDFAVLLAKQGNAYISDELEFTFSKLERLYKENPKDKQLKKDYISLLNIIKGANWKGYYVENAIILDDYLDTLNDYLQENYSLEDNISKRVNKLKSKLGISTLSKEISRKSFEELNDELIEKTNMTYGEIKEALSTTRGMELIAYSLGLSVGAVENTFNEGKFFLLLGKLLKLQKLGDVLYGIYDKKDTINLIAGLNK